MLLSASRLLFVHGCTSGFCAAGRSHKHLCVRHIDGGNAGSRENLWREELTCAGGVKLHRDVREVWRWHDGGIITWENEWEQVKGLLHSRTRLHSVFVSSSPCHQPMPFSIFYSASTQQASCPFLCIWMHFEEDTPIRACKRIPSSPSLWASTSSSGFQRHTSYPRGDNCPSQRRQCQNRKDTRNTSTLYYSHCQHCTLKDNILFILFYYIYLAAVLQIKTDKPKMWSELYFCWLNHLTA